MASKSENNCGVVMPISECDGKSENHWRDVFSIIEQAANKEGLVCRLVSDTFESNLIHKEILQNIYEDQIIICDVSGRNPNVFFELGVRMATQKPTVIIKDDKTAYPFDTGPNRYIEYPRDLRHPAMEDFKRKLSAALVKTLDHGPENSFIGQLGPFKVPDIESTSVTTDVAILDKLERLERLVSPRDNFHTNKMFPHEEVRCRTSPGEVHLCLRGIGQPQIDNGISVFLDETAEDTLAISTPRRLSDKHYHVDLTCSNGNEEDVADLLTKSIEDAISF